MVNRQFLDNGSVRPLDCPYRPGHPPPAADWRNPRTRQFREDLAQVPMRVTFIQLAALADGIHGRGPIATTIGTGKRERSRFVQSNTGATW